MAKADDEFDHGRSSDRANGYGLKEEEAELKLLGDRSGADRRAVRWIRCWRRSPAGAPAAQSTRCPSPGAVVQRDSEQDTG